MTQALLTVTYQRNPDGTLTKTETSLAATTEDDHYWDAICEFVGGESPGTDARVDEKQPA
ncbi:MAG: hypothetical protein ACM3UP_02205 [Methanocella sp.]